MKRDLSGIIVQGRRDDPTYGDGGDSAFSTGMMAWAGSKTDIELMHFFINDLGKLVRHPITPWNNHTLTSRDQLVAFFAGLPNYKGPFQTKLAQSCLNYARENRINKDILTPDIKLYLYKCCNVEAPWHIKVTGMALAKLNIYWHSYIKPDHEMNQPVVIADKLGLLKDLIKRHPNLKKNLYDYYCGWRDKVEMFDQIYGKVIELDYHNDI